MITQNTTGKHLPLFARTPTALKKQQTEQPNSSDTLINQPDTPNSPNNTTRSHLPLTDINKTIEHFENQLKQYPDYEPFRNVVLTILANLHQKNNNISKAIEYTEQSSSGPDNLIESLEKLAQNCLTTNNPSGAIQSYEHILTLPHIPLDKQIEILKNLKDIYLNNANSTQNIHQLIKCYKRIANLSGVPLNHQIYALSNIACIYHETQRHAVAVPYYERLYSLPGIEIADQYKVLLNLATLYHETGDLDKQIESYERIFALPGITQRNQDLSTLAQLYRKKGNPFKAIELYENQLTHSDQLPISTLTQLVELHEESNNIPSQIKYLNLITTSKYLSPHYHQIVLHKLRTLYLKINNTTLLISTLTQLADAGEPHHYEEILNLPTATPTQRYNALRALVNQAKPMHKLQYLERILLIPNLNPHCRLQTLIDLIQLSKKIDNIDKEIWCHEQILVCSQSTPQVQIHSLYELINIYNRLNDPHKATDGYNRILSLPEIASTPFIHYKILRKLSKIYAETKNTPKEIECHESILSLPHIQKNYKEFSDYIQIKQTETIQSLIDIYNKFDNPIQIIQGYERILTLPNLTPEIELISLNLLLPLYSQSQNSQKQIEYIERIINHPKATLIQKYNILTQLAKLYTESNNITIAIQYYEKILNLTHLDLLKKIQTLNALSKLHNITQDTANEKITLYELIAIHRTLNNTDSEIQCLERILLISDPFFPPHITARLAQLHQESDNPHKAITYYTLYLQTSRLDIASECNTIDELAKLYMQIKKFAQALVYYEHLLVYLNSFSLRENRKNENEPDIFQKNDNYAKRIECYRQLAIIYGKSCNTPKQIQCYQTILDFPNINQKNKIDILQKLIPLYLNSNDFLKAKECQFQILKLNPALHIETLLIFLNHPTSGLPLNTKALINKKPQPEKNKILNLLASYPWLWSDIKGKPEKLNKHQWKTVLIGPDTPSELERLALQPCFTTLGLNPDIFFNDPTMPEWNILVQRKSVITDNNWEITESDLLNIFDTIHSPDQHQRKYLSKFLSQCMESKGAQKPIPKQLLRKRITACVDYLTNLLTSKPEDSTTINFLQNSLAIMIVGGTSCPDRAVVFLTTLETNIKLFKNPQYLPNVIAHRYKFEAITQTLVPDINDPIEVDSKGIPIIKENENLETLFDYTQKLNKPLGLGLDNSTQILYQYLAKTVPLELTIEPLSSAFTQEKLLNFTIQEPTFIKKFETNKNSAIPPEKHQEYLESINHFSDALGSPEENEKNDRVNQIQVEIKLLEKNYFLNEAKKMYIESGHIYNY